MRSFFRPRPISYGMKDGKLGSTSGQLMVELIVALSMVTVGLLGVIALINRALSVNRVISNEFTATYLAAEGIELARNLVDRNVVQGIPWNSNVSDGSFELDYLSTEFEANQDRQLLFDPDSKLYTYTPEVAGSPSLFTRRIDILQGAVQTGSSIDPVCTPSGDPVSCSGFGMPTCAGVGAPVTCPLPETPECPFTPGDTPACVSTPIFAPPFKMRVNSVVDWVTRGGATSSINLEDHFYDFYPD